MSQNFHQRLETMNLMKVLVLCATKGQNTKIGKVIESDYYQEYMKKYVECIVPNI